MKFGRIVLQVNTHRLTESDFIGEILRYYGPNAYCVQQADDHLKLKLKTQHSVSLQ